jgi:hypothetical protein
VLSHNAWQQHEPRLNFPVFDKAENFIDFSLQRDARLTLKRVVAPGYYFISGRKSIKETVRNYHNIIMGESYRFKGIFLDRSGKELLSAQFPGEYWPGDFFHCNLNEWLLNQKIAIQNGNLILIASRGREDRFMSSPGNVTLRVLTNKNVCGYRTGFFSRPLNAGHKHYGFTGLNPHVELNERWASSLLLINHSSDPAYDRSVRPTVRLYRADGNFIETPYGDIPPHAALEMGIGELFPQAFDFLSTNGGRGYTITRVKGASLASIHVTRTTNGELVSMEHSRPAHPIVVDYF